MSPKASKVKVLKTHERPGVHQSETVSGSPKSRPKGVSSEFPDFPPLHININIINYRKVT